jgi:hypothetical protein
VTGHALGSENRLREEVKRRVATLGKNTVQTVLCWLFGNTLWVLREPLVSISFWGSRFLNGAGEDQGAWAIGVGFFNTEPLPRLYAASI